MAVRYQLVIDCANPDLLARFWAAALKYEIEPPPAGFASWDDYYRDIGVPEDELGIGVDSIIDPEGGGPRIWFQVVPDDRVVKNRLHLDIRASGGRAIPLATRKEQVDAEARRLCGLGATWVGVAGDEGLDHYGVAMKDPEATSSTSTDGTRRRAGLCRHRIVIATLLGAARRGQSTRSTSIDSSTAAGACACVRYQPPKPAICGQRRPAPKPSSNRPPDSAADAAAASPGT